MFGGVGAYFGSTRIHEGAAGLGQDGELAAFADGIVGGSPNDAQTPGLLQAYHDGSLGYYDQASHGLGDDSLSVFQDGVLGEPFDASTSGPGTLQAYHDGSLGYLGAIAAASDNVLDLGDPNVLKEVKMAMALLAPEATLTADAQKLYTPDWYMSGIWEPESSILWQHVLQKAPSGSPFSADAGTQVYPNASGVAWMAATIGAPTSTSYGPQYLAKTMPAMNAFIHAGAGKVLPPFLSLTDKTKGTRATANIFGMSPMVAYGLGAAAVLGIVLLMRK